MDLKSLFAEHFVSERIVSDGYAASMRSSIRTLEKMLGRESTTDDLSDQVLRKVGAWCVGRKLSRATANRVLRSLIALANFARKSGLSNYRPDVQKIPEQRKTPICWTPDEFTRVMQSIRTLGGNWSKIMQAIVLVAYDTGLRIIDVVNIQYVDCDLDKRIVRASEKKTGKRRVFTIHPQTVSAIREARKLLEDDRLIPYQFKETNPLRIRLRKALELANLPHGRKDLFQKIRRSTVTLGAAAGMDPTKIAGHSARWVTETYYLDPNQEPPLDVSSMIPRPR